MLPLIKKFNFTPKSNNKVLIISGAHGDELTPLRTMWLLNDYLSKSKLVTFSDVHSVTTIMGANHTGIKNNSRNLVPDNHKGDMNRMFDEDYDFDTVGELNKLIEEHNVIIDIHSSPRVNEFVLVDLDEYTEFIVKWLKKAGVPYGCRFPVSNGTIKKYSLLNNKVGVTIELNGLDRIDYGSASKGEMIVTNLLSSINFDMKKDFQIPKNMGYVDEIWEMEEIKAGCEGILMEKFQGGEKIKMGAVLAQVVDYEMKPIRDIVAKYDAFIVSLPSYHYVTPTSPIYTLMRIK